MRKVVEGVDGCIRPTGRTAQAFKLPQSVETGRASEIRMQSTSIDKHTTASATRCHSIESTLNHVRP